jgi:hypothetical protein
MPNDYPSTPPTVQFITPVFHPLIGEDGKLDIVSEFPDWTATNRKFVWDVLAYVKKIFYQKSSTLPPLNTEAHHLYNSNKAEFTKKVTSFPFFKYSFLFLLFLFVVLMIFLLKVTECVENSISNVYNNPEGSTLRFTEWSKELDGVKENLFKKEQKEGGLLSWVSKSVSNVSKIISIKY